MLFLLVVLFLAYLPATSCLFFLKNDAFNGYFPPKFFMSESLHAGFLPLWNPYINFGIPQYGDMSSGFWSPITWLIAGTVGYNAYSFTFEVFLYVLLAGMGMYRLCRGISIQANICMLAAVAYMCSGYMVGHLQHFNWISGAAFLPWCLWAYQKLQEKFSLKHILAAALFFYMLLSSAHPGISIGAIYFFIGYAFFQIISGHKNISIKSKLASFTKINIILALAICLLSAGMLAGYLDIIPFMTRGEKVELAESLAHPLSFTSWLSFILPLSIVKNEALFNTDLAMRNIYFGLVPLIFFLTGIIKRKTPLQLFLLITGVTFILLSSGGIFKTFAYYAVPLIGYVRLDGEFAIFSLLCFIPFAAIAANNHIQNNEGFSGPVKYLYYALEIGLAIAITIGLYKTFSTGDGFVYQLKQVTAEPGMALKLKAFIDSISFYDTLWLQGIVQLIFLWFIKFNLKKKNYQWLLRIGIADIMLATLLNVPFTGVGKASVAQVQEVLNRSPKGIPVPALTPIYKNDTISTEDKGLVGNWSFYSKQPGLTVYAPYPIELNSMQKIFYTRQFFSKPYLFVTGDAQVKVNKFTGNSIDATVTSTTSSKMVLQQNYFKHWYIYNDEGKSAAASYKNIFLSAPVSMGPNNIRFVFEPTFIKIMMLLSAVSFLIFLIVYFYLSKKERQQAKLKPLET